MLNKDRFLTKLMVLECHERTYYNGVKHTLANSRYFDNSGLIAEVIEQLFYLKKNKVSQL